MPVQHGTHPYAIGPALTSPESAAETAPASRSGSYGQRTASPDAAAETARLKAQPAAVRGHAVRRAPAPQAPPLGVRTQRRRAEASRGTARESKGVDQEGVAVPVPGESKARSPECTPEGLTARNHQQHRQVLAAMFAYGCRSDNLALAHNPVGQADKRRQNPPSGTRSLRAREVEVLARCCEAGRHRSLRPSDDPAEVAAREREDRRDADAFRLLFYTSLRLGGALTQRWEDVNLTDRLVVRHGRSSG